MKRVQQSEEQEQVSPLKRVRPSVAASDALFETQILTNPLITDVIFSDMLFSDLLSCSLVSKSWNRTCRGILVDRFKTYLTVSEESTEERLEGFYNVIKGVVPGHQHPFNGIRIKFNTRVCEWPFSSEPFAVLISRIMQQFQVKCVSFDMSKLHLRGTEFQDIFKTLVMPHMRTIEVLEVLSFRGLENLHLSQQLRANSLPNLKELHLHLSRERLRNATFSSILAACPNLKTFPPVSPYQLPVLRYKNKLHLAFKVRFNYMHLTGKDMQLLCEYGSLIKRLKINQHLNEFENEYEGDSISKLEPLFAPQRLQNLESLDINLEPLVALLLQNNAPALPNITKLCVRGGQAWFPCLFKNNAVRFAHFFANLKSVTFSWSTRISDWLQSNYRSADYGLAPMSLLECQIPSSLDSVTALKLCSLKKQRADEALMKIMDLDQVFPHVSHLEIAFNHTELKNLLRWICESTWGDLLKTLILQGTKCLVSHKIVSVGMEFPLSSLEDQKRKPLPHWTMYSDKLSKLQRLELKFCHPKKPYRHENCEEEKPKVQAIFEPRQGHQVQVLISGCSAQKRIKSIESGVSIYDTILALHSCPRILKLSAMEEIVATKSICTNICKMLPTPDLLHCSLVNRRWNAVSREVLHQTRPCTLRINEMYLTKNLLPSRLNCLVYGKQKFFNGLRIPFARIHLNHDLISFEAVTRLMELSDPIPTRFREIQLPSDEFKSYVSDEVTGGSDQFRVGMLKVCKQLLKYLELDHIQKLVTSIKLFDSLFRDPVDGKLLVCNVKSIDFVDSEKLAEYSDVFRRLLEELKCLERIEFSFSNKLLPHVSTAGRAHCVKHIRMNECVNEYLFLLIDPQGLGHLERMRAQEDPTTAIGSLLAFAQEYQPQLEKLEMSSSFILFSPVLKKVLQLLCTSSWESLQTLRLNLPALNQMSRVATLPLVKVERLELLFYEAVFDSPKLLTQIPFSDMLPNLEIVILHQGGFSPDLSYPAGIFGEAESWNAASSARPSLQPCTSVKSLEFEVVYGSEPFKKYISSTPEPWNMQYVAGVFPRVSKFSFVGLGSGTGEEVVRILGPLWKTWPDLESIRIYAYGVDTAMFESWILGISTEEWSFWKEQLGGGKGSPPDILNSMHYAPSSYSIRNCKKLQHVMIFSMIQTCLLRTVSESAWNRICLAPNTSKGN